MTQTIEDIDLEQLFSDDDIECEYCGDEANWLMMHDEAKHFNCNKCAAENQSDLNKFIAAGLKVCYCITCERPGVELKSISIVPI